MRTTQKRYKPAHAGTKEAARATSPKKASALSVWLEGAISSLLRPLFGSLGRMQKSLLSTLMTVLVIAIALALPAGFKVVLANIGSSITRFDGVSQISLFLELGAVEEKALALQSQILQMPGVAGVDYLSPDKALEEFIANSGLSEAMAVLDSNPLPPLLVVTPKKLLDSPIHVEALAAQLQELKGVDLVQIDMEWIRRLHGVISIFQRGAWIISILLGIGVLLIVGNTIRLDILNRRDEIVITKLVGATDRFVRRPFLCTGIWYGVFGGLLAWLMIGAGLWMLNEPVQRLALAYQSQFRLEGLGFTGGVRLVLFSVLLSLGGAWIAVDRHLRKINPT